MASSTRSRAQFGTQILKGDALAIVSGRGRTIRGQVLRHFECLKCFKVGNTDNHGCQPAIAGHPDSLTGVHGASEDIGKLRAQLAR